MKTIPQGITIIYFNDNKRNIYAKLPPDREQAKRLSQRIFRNAMTTLSAERQRQETLLNAVFNSITAIPLDNTVQTE